MNAKCQQQILLLLLSLIAKKKQHCELLNRSKFSLHAKKSKGKWKKKCRKKTRRNLASNHKKNKTKPRWRSLLDVTITTIIIIIQTKYWKREKQSILLEFPSSFFLLWFALLLLLPLLSHSLFCRWFVNFFSSFALHFFHLFNFYLYTMPFSLSLPFDQSRLTTIHDSCVLLFFCDVPTLCLRVFCMRALYTMLHKTRNHDDQPQNHFDVWAKMEFLQYKSTQYSMYITYISRHATRRTTIPILCMSYDEDSFLSACPCVHNFHSFYSFKFTKEQSLIPSFAVASFIFFLYIQIVCVWMRASVYASQSKLYWLILCIVHIVYINFNNLGVCRFNRLFLYSYPISFDTFYRRMWSIIR